MQDPLRGVICVRPSQGCYLCKTLSGVLFVQDPLRGVICADVMYIHMDLPVIICLVRLLGLVSLSTVCRFKF